GVPAPSAVCREFSAHRGMAEPFAEPSREQPADKIRAAARRRPGHDPERARWPLLRSGRDGKRCGKGNGEEAREHPHARSHRGESPAVPEVTATGDVITGSNGEDRCLPKTLLPDVSVTRWSAALVRRP